MSNSTHAQELMKRILLNPETVSNIKYDTLNINALLQVYDKKSADHLIGDVYLGIENNGVSIAEFYVNGDSKGEYLTRIYNNYFLTFLIENTNKYLVIAPAQLGRAFALSSNGTAIIGDENNLVEIEITDYTHEWGSDAPFEGEEMSHFDDVQYSLKLKTSGVVNTFSFYSSEIKDGYPIEIGNFRVLILSDKYKDSSSLIEMIVNKK